MARIITITSGKGGVGKTSISLNLSLSLASKEFKVCLFDADLGLANVNILTDIYPKKDLKDVISGELGLNEIMIKDFQRIDIIPGSSGVKRMADLSQTQTGTLISAFLDLELFWDNCLSFIEKHKEKTVSDKMRDTRDKREDPDIAKVLSRMEKRSLLILNHGLKKSPDVKKDIL